VTLSHLLPSTRPLPRSKGLGHRQPVGQEIWPQALLCTKADTQVEQSVSELNENKCFSYKTTPVLCKFHKETLVPFLGICQVTIMLFQDTLPPSGL
jgi:hypothetical protein